ncbi:hypothetical protein L1O48_07630, partial [Ligilactobacillus equi]|uniref:KxYKxGKxW signal peptide domain-containing protein n=1 Tax=Ligilactobacillus equi TaxID=137357 RepID=UPI002ED3AD30
MLTRYSKKSRLLSRYTAEEKRRYKLYKHKTKWVVAGMAFFGTSVVSAGVANADSTDVTADATSSSDSTSPDDDSQKQASSQLTNAQEVTTTPADTAATASTDQAQASTAESTASEATPVKDDSQAAQASSSQAQTDTNSAVKEAVAPQADDKQAATASQTTKQAPAAQETAQKQANEAQPTKTNEAPKVAVELATPQKQATDTTIQAVDDSQVVAKVAQALQQLKGVSPEQAQTIAKDVLVNDRQTALQLAELVAPTMSQKAVVSTPSRSELAAMLATSLIVDPTTAPQYTGQDMAYVDSINTNLEGNGIKITSEGQQNNGNLNYTLTQTNLYGRNVVMRVKYFAKKGDKVTMIITPNTKGMGYSSNNLNGSFGVNKNGIATNVTGNPTVEKVQRSDGTWQYALTWTVMDGSEGATQEYTQTLPPLDWFQEYSYVYKMEAVKPYANQGTIYRALSSTGDNYTISFLITDKEGNSGIYQKGQTTVTLKKDGYITDASVSPETGASYKGGGILATSDTNYLYHVNYNTNVDKANSYYFSSLHFEVQVPEHFVLDQAATEEYLKNNSNWYGGISITQAGEGQPIIIESKDINQWSTSGNGPYQFFPVAQGDIDFIGHYTKAAEGNNNATFKVTSGYSTSSGDKQDKKSFTGTKVLTEKVLAPTDPLIHEDWYQTFVYYDNQDRRWKSLTVSPADKNNNAYDASEAGPDGRDLTEGWRYKRRSEIDPAAPVLYTIGLGSKGATDYTPTYKLVIPDGITSTGLVVPLKNIDDKAADYNSYGPAIEKYKVVVTADDGSQVTQELAAGESYQPLTGEINNAGTIRTDGAKIANGHKIVKYEVTPETPYYANSKMYGDSDQAGANDIRSGAISVFGFVDDTTDKDKIDLPVIVTSEHKTMEINYTVHVLNNPDLPVDWNSMSSSTGNTGNISTFAAGKEDNNTRVIYDGPATDKGSKNPNLDAAGILTGKANSTSTDGPGANQNTEYPATHPVFYVTYPNNVIPEAHSIEGVKSFYSFVRGEISTKSGDDYRSKIKVRFTKNDKGQTVGIFDFSDPDLKISPNLMIYYYYRIAADALNSMDPINTNEDMYEYYDAEKRSMDLYTAQQLKDAGISTDGLVLRKANYTGDAPSTSWIQVARNGVENTTLAKDNPEKRAAKITLANGETIDTYVMHDPSVFQYFKIIAQEQVKPLPLISGTVDGQGSWKSEGTNYSAKDYTTDSQGKITGLQSLKFTMFNNTANTLTNAYAVMNLPQEGKVDPNTPNADKAEFTLNISGAGELNPSEDNNTAKDKSTVYYSTSTITVSPDGKTYTFEDGSSWTLGTPVPADKLMTANQVSDWSKVKAMVMDIPKLSKLNKVTYDFNLYSPTSVDGKNAGKKSSLTEVMSYTGQTANLTETITDEYQTYATLKYVDQDGNEINGYAPIKGEATYDAETGTFVPNAEGLIGNVGDPINTDPYVLGDIPHIKGYVYQDVSTNSNNFIKDGSTVITRKYIIDKAQLRLNSTTGQLLASAIGDENPNNGSDWKDNETGTDDIQFKGEESKAEFTDTNLAKPGYSYTIDVYQSKNGGNLTKVNADSFTSLSDALSAYPTFDDQADTGATPTQVFVVNYQPDFQQAVIISDNDPEKKVPVNANDALGTPTTDYQKDDINYGTGNYYSFGITDAKMFKDSSGQDGTTDDVFKRSGYNYTLTTPEGQTYNSISEWLATNPTFDDTDNPAGAKTDSHVQVFTVHYVAQTRAITYTVVDDTTGETLTKEPQSLAQGNYNDVIPTTVLDKYNNVPKNDGYLDKGYTYVGHDALPDKYGFKGSNEDTAWTEDAPYNVVIHLKHTLVPQALTQTVKETIAY